MPHSNRMDLIKRSELPEWLQRKFGTASKLAAALGTTRQTSYNLLTGRTHPNDETCKKLGLDPVYLIETPEQRRQMSTLEQFLNSRTQTEAISAAAAKLLREHGIDAWEDLKRS